MTPLFFYDTETTGLPDWKSPSDDPCQPHLIQLAVIVAEEETRKEMASISLLVQPDGYSIPSEIAELTGIDDIMAISYGVPEVDALSAFMNLFLLGGKRIAHNKTFDQRIIRIALKRFDFDQKMIDKWAETENHFCTMQAAKSVMKMPAKRGFKSPTMGEAYEFFTGKTLEGAHNAMVDARACMEVYFAMKDAGHEV